MDGVLSIEKKSRARLHASPPQYTATDPGALGGRSRVAIAINNHDEIIGTAEIIDGDLAWPLSWKRRPFAQPPVLFDDIDMKEFLQGKLHRCAPTRKDTHRASWMQYP